MLNGCRRQKEREGEACGREVSCYGGGLEPSTSVFLIL